MVTKLKKKKRAEKNKKTAKAAARIRAREAYEKIDPRIRDQTFTGKIERRALNTDEGG